MSEHISVELFEVDDLTDMLDHVVTALRITNVTRDEPRDFPAAAAMYDAFTAQSMRGNVGRVRVHVTAFTPQQDTP